MHNENLKVLLKDTAKTLNILDLIQAEIKEMSIAVYDRLYKDFKGNAEQRKLLNRIAESEIEINSFNIRNKHFNTL